MMPCRRPLVRTADLYGPTPLERRRPQPQVSRAVGPKRYPKARYLPALFLLDKGVRQRLRNRTRWSPLRRDAHPWKRRERRTWDVRHEIRDFRIADRGMTSSYRGLPFASGLAVPTRIHPRALTLKQAKRIRIIVTDSEDSEIEAIQFSQLLWAFFGQIRSTNGSWAADNRFGSKTLRARMLALNHLWNLRPGQWISVNFWAWRTEFRCIVR